MRIVIDNKYAADAEPQDHSWEICQEVSQATFYQLIQPVSPKVSVPDMEAVLKRAYLIIN